MPVVLLLRSLSKIKRYCEVTGYVAAAKQVRVETEKSVAKTIGIRSFSFTLVAGSAAPSLETLAILVWRGATPPRRGNGGHDSALGFDGILAANAPELQVDFGWRSNHVVTLIAKAIIAHYYGKPIKYSYMVGNSRAAKLFLWKRKGSRRTSMASTPGARLRLYWTQYDSRCLVCASRQ